MRDTFNAACTVHWFLSGSPYIWSAPDQELAGRFYQWWLNNSNAVYYKLYGSMR